MNKENLNENFIKGAEEIRKISMTPNEKANILENILKTSTCVPLPQKSPYASKFFISMFQHKFIYAGSMLCLVFVLGGGAVFASNESLPGSTLYPFKVKIVEPIYGSLMFSDEQKIKYENTLIKKRFTEAGVLAVNNNLDEGKAEQINTLLYNHTQAFIKVADSSNKNGKIDDDSYDDLVVSFQAELNARAKVLDLLSGKTELSQSNEHAKISEKARDNAKKIREDLKNKEKKDRINSKKTKASVQLLIDKTLTDLDSADANSSPEKQKIIIDSKEALENARKFLKEVDTEDEKGNLEDAHERLLDSESAAKEAGILFNLGLSL